MGTIKSSGRPTRRRLVFPHLGDPVRACVMRKLMHESGRRDRRPQYAGSSEARAPREFGGSRVEGRSSYLVRYRPRAWR